MVKNTVIKLGLFVLGVSAFVCDAARVTVEWDAASTTVDGKALGHVDSYKVFYGDVSGVYDGYVVVTDATSVELDMEYNKNHYFSIKTCTDGVESDFSEELVWTAPVMADADSDGISDDWEMTYFGDLESANSGSDFDGNGISDLNEFVGGTNPTDPQDSPKLGFAAKNVISFEAVPASGDGYENRARAYALEYCEDLSSGDWSAVAGMDQIAADGQNVRYDLPLSGGRGFYRMAISLN